MFHLIVSWTCTDKLKKKSFIKIIYLASKCIRKCHLWKCLTFWSIHQCINSSPPSATYMHQWTGWALVQVMACHLFGDTHYLNQCRVIVNWTLRNKLQWNFNQNTKPFIHENASENVVCEMAAILSRGRWVLIDPWSSPALGRFNIIMICPIRFHAVLKPGDMFFKMIDCSKVWQASQQQCCLMIRCLIMLMQFGNRPQGRLNIKMSSYQYRDSHV